MTKKYHVGLLRRNQTAVFQFRSTVDELDCEILKYFGVRETTKAAARQRLNANRDRALAQVQQSFPAKGFNHVTID